MATWKSGLCSEFSDPQLVFSYQTQQSWESWPPTMAPWVSFPLQAGYLCKEPGTHTWAQSLCPGSGHTPANSCSQSILRPRGAPGPLRGQAGRTGPGSGFETVWTGNSLEPGGRSGGSCVLHERLRAQLCREKMPAGGGEARGQAPPASICLCLPGSAPKDSLSRLKRTPSSLAWSLFSGHIMLLRSSNDPLLYSTSVRVECLISSLV